MTESIEILSNVFAIITGIVGAVTGILAYKRSLKTERITFQEPYFRNVWTHLSEQLKDTEDKIHYYQINIVDLFASYDLNNPINEIEVPDTKFDLSYSIKFEKSYLGLANKVSHFNQLIRKYNKDYYFAHRDFEFAIKLKDYSKIAGVKEVVSDDNNKLLSDIEEYTKRVKKYYPNKTTNLLPADALRNNQQYLNELELLKAEIISEFKNFKVDDELKRLKHFYDEKFAK